MPQYEVSVPGKGTFSVSSPTELTDQQVWLAVQRQLELPEPPAPPPPPEGGFFPSVKRGFLQTQMLVGDVLPAMFGKAIGAEEYAKKQWEEAAETQKRIEREVPAAVPSYKDISSFGDAWVYAKEAVGESLASIIPSLLTGGAASLLARPAIAAANTAAREAAEKTLMSAALSMGPPTQATMAGLEKAKQAAIQAGIDAAKRTAFRYEVAGGLAGSALQNIPEVYQNIKEETGKEDIPAALIAGGFNAALDTVLPVQLLKKIRGQGLSEKEIMGAWFKRGAAGLGKGFLTEGATEAAQEASSILAENFVAENSDVFNAKNLERVINAGLKGGLGGGVITAATDIATGKAPPPEQTDRQRIEQLQREILGDVQTARSEKALEEAENAKKAAEDAEAARKEAERAPTVPELITIAQGQNAYSALEAEKQRLLGQEKKTKEVKEAIEVIKELQGRLVIEDVTRRAPSVPAEMDDKTIRSLGFVKSENPESVYQQLLGKSTRDPDVTAFLKNYAETKAKPQTKDRINTFLGRVERAQIPLTAEEIAEGERRAREAVTEPSGAGAPMVGEPGAGAPAAGVGVTQPSGVVPPVAPVGEPPVGEGAAPAPVGPPPVTPPAASPVEAAAPPAAPPAPAPAAPPVAPPAEPLISLPPRLQNITPAERDLYNFNQSLVEAQTPITGFDFERISDAPSPDGRGMTPESLVLSLEGTLGAVKDLDGKLRSKNRTGATVSQLIDQWKTASQIQARINQSKQDNPELWSNYAARQKELGGLKVGDLIQIETGEIGKLDAKFPKNWRIVFDESTPGILAGTKLLRPKGALRPAPAPPSAPAEAAIAASKAPSERQERIAFGKAIGAAQQYPGILTARVNIPAQTAVTQNDFPGVVAALQKSKSPVVAEVANRARGLNTNIVIDEEAAETYAGKSPVMQQLSIDGAKMHIDALEKIRRLASQVDALPNGAVLPYSIIGETIPGIENGEQVGNISLEKLAGMGTTMFAQFPGFKLRTKEDFKALQKAFEDTTSDLGENKIRMTSTGSAETIGVSGVYDANTNTIRVPSYFAKNEGVLTHEIVHAQTVQAVANPNLRQKPVVIRLNKLYDHVKAELEAKAKTEDSAPPYGVASIQEFIAEGMSNPRFQFQLSKIKYQNTTAWDAFVEVIANLLGLKKDTAFTELLAIYSELMPPSASDVADIASTPAAAPAPTAAPAAPAIITAEQLIGFGVKKTQPMIRRIAGKNMDVPADRANVLAELNKYINNKDNSSESRENLTKFRDQFEEVGKTVTVAPTKAKKPWKTVMGSQLLALVDRTGGLDPSLMQEFSTKFITKRLSKSGKQLVQFRNPPTQNGQLFRAGGMSDYVEIAELLEGAGYLEPGAVEADYKEAGERAKTLISTALNRGQVLTLEQQEQEARLRQEDIDKQEQAKQEQLKVEREAEALAERQAIIEAEGLTPADLDTLEDNIPFLTEAVEKTPERLAADMRDMGFTEEEISDAVTEFSRKAVAAQAPEARAEEATQAPAAPKAAEELELEAPTAEELAAREKREADAREAEREEQKRLEQKERADAERGEFVLTGSDRPADVAAAAGQMDIFSAPATEEALTKPDGPKKAEQVSTAVVEDALDKADLAPEETQRLEAAFNAKTGSKPFLDRLVQEVQKYIAKGAQSVAKNLRDSIGKIVKAVLGIAVVFNVSTAFPVKQIYAQPQVPAIDVTSAEQLFSSTLDLNGRTLSPNALRVANWIANNAKKDEISLVLDTQAGKLIVMKGPKIISDAPALFGKGGVEAINDRILQMSTDRMEDADRITPAGKFPAKMEKDATYGSTITFFPAKTGAYAIHRVYLGTPAERRAERLATSSAEDNNISYGCVNVSSEYYDNVLAKLDLTGEANAYLLPSDPKKLEQFFPTVPKYSLAEAVKPPSVTLSKETQAKIDELSGLLQKMLGKMGLKNVALNLAQDLERNGEYANRLITLALDATNPVRDLRHESLHAMKELGFFSDAQWATLTKMARDKWIDKYLKSRQSVYNGQAMSRYDAYMRLYNGNEDLIIEEAIADAFGDFDATKAPPGLMQAILFRMREFFRNIKEAMGMANIDSAEDIFRRVERGELKETAPAVEAPARPSLRAPETEAFKRWFGDSKVVDESGRPVPVYHATRAPKTGELFSQFRLSDDGKLGEGIYASSIPEYAEGYSIRGPLMPLWASIENPFVINIDSKFIEYETAPFGETEIPGGRKYPYISSEKPIKEQIEQFVREQTRGKQRAADLMGDSLRQLFEKAGYDGVVVKDDDGNFLEVNAFRPEQIKSATGNIGTYDITKPDIRYSLRDAIGLYSELENKIAQGPNAAPAPQWKAYIKGLVQKGVKPEEIEWSGVNDWLDLQTGRVSKEALNNYLKQGGVRVEETVLGGRAPWRERLDFLENLGYTFLTAAERNELQTLRDRFDQEGPTPEPENLQAKFSNYTLPGGENYREALLTLPAKSKLKPTEIRIEPRENYPGSPGGFNAFVGDKFVGWGETEEEARTSAIERATPDVVGYQSTHWDQPNVLAHIRVNDRTDADGKRVLFVEELQSDWQQARGSLERKLKKAKTDEERAGIQQQIDALPKGPFVGNTEGWLNLALKRVMVMAAEGGYDKVAFVNGEQSADRYDLSKQVNYIQWNPGYSSDPNVMRALVEMETVDGKMIGFEVDTPPGGVGTIAEGDFAGKTLEDVVGKEIAQKINESDSGDLRGLDLKVGGEGMKTFYDTIVPTAVKKLLPKVGGGQMGTVGVQVPPASALDPQRTSLRETIAQPGFDVTPDMKQKVQTTGLPRFSLRDVPRANLRDQLNITTLQRIEQTTVAREEKGFVQRITEAISPKNFGFFRQQALNRYEGLSRADRMKIEQMGGVDLLADAGAESAALLSDMGAGVTASALGVHDRKGGAPVYNHYFVVEVNNRALAKRYTSKAQAQAAASAVNGVVRERGYVTVSNFNDSVKGPVLIFAPLMEKYKDPMIFQAFQFYSAAKRGARFMYTLDAKGNVIEKLFTADDINIELPRLEAQFPEFKTVHAEWIKYNDKLVDYMRDTGVISEQNAQTFKMHGDYFPFYRQIDGQDDALGPRIFQSISAVKPPKKLKGSELALGDFLENIVRNTQSAVQAGVKNVAARRAAQVGMDVGIVSEIAPGVTPESANSFYVLENGLKKFYETTDHLFIDSIKSLNLPDMPFIGMLAGPANLLRNLVTKDPGFILANLMRDSMSAWATSGVKMTPIVDTMRNFAGALVNQSPEYKALLNAGVIGGYEFSQNIQTSGKEFGAAIRKTAGVPTFGEKIAKPFTSVWETLEKATTASDAATRMEIYKRTLAETGNEAEAIFRALEVMNFNRKGSSAVIRILTAAVPFLNARMQGLDILYRAAIAPTVRGDTSERARQIQKTFFVRGAYLMALSAMYWLLTHDDEEYKKQEQETRDNYWLLPSLGIKIPIPFEVGVLFKVIPERILAYTLGTDTGKDFADSMKRQLISTLAFNPIPQTALPLVETVTNFSFFTWRPIIPQGLENVAPEYQVGPGTSKLAEGIGKTLKLSPMKIDQIINGYTGTMGMYAVDLMDSIYNTMADSPKPSKRFEQMPVIRRFAVDPEARGTVTAYYDLKNAVDQVVRTENLLERTMDYENWGPYMQENMKLLASKDYVSDMEKTLKELREMKTLIRASTMSADAKRDSITQIGQMENALTANIQQLKKMFRE